tara:strand:+ start:748 stop:1674 length:927 start_codon:yes stop_codon:yes gene_type:complete
VAESYTQIQREAPYLEDFRRRLLQGAFDLTQTPGTVSQQQIAGMQPLQTGAMEGIASVYGLDPVTGLPTGTGAQYDPGFAKGIATLNQATQQYDPSSSNYNQFFNQYQADVTAEALKQMDDQAQQARNRLAGDATMGKTFGGSRYEIARGELENNLQDIKSRRIFQDLAQNFEQAQQKAISTSESAAGRQMSAAPMFTNFGVQQSQLNQQGLGQLFNFGQQQQAEQQAQFNEQFRQDESKRMDPFQRTSYYSDILQGVPSVSQTLTQKPMPYTNPTLGGIGMGLGAYGLLNQSGGSGSTTGGPFSLFS